MHYGGVFVLNIVEVDPLSCVGVEPNPHVAGHVPEQDSNVVVSVWPLVFMHQADGVTHFV